MRILFIGDAWLGSNARSLANGFRLLGHDVLQIDTSAVNRPQRWTPDWAYSKAFRRRNPRTVEDVHAQIEAAYDAFRPQIVFCFKTIHLHQERLAMMNKALLLHYSADDVSNPYNTTTDYLIHEPSWDAVITTKKHNVGELAERGVANPIFISSAYDPALHHPVARRTPVQYKIGFLGNRRPDRQGLMRHLADRYGQTMAIGGPGWEHDAFLRRSAAQLLPGAYGEDFSYFVASVRANLVLLNSDNRDTHTCRSYEVPAAGGLFVGERTSEHLDMLDDGDEAFMFEGLDELLEVVDRIESDPQTASLVAERGYRRITGGGNSYMDRAAEILERTL